MTRRTRSGLIVSLCVGAGLSGCAAPEPVRVGDMQPGIGRFDQPLARSELRERAFETLLEGTVSPDPLIRAHSLEGLKSVPTRAEPALRAALADPNAGVRFVAAAAIGALRLESSVPFVRPLMRDADARVRAAAIFALSVNGERVDITPLANMLREADPRIRSEAARTLGELGNRSAIPMLRQAASARPAFRSDPSTGEMSISQAEHLFQLQVAEAMVKLGEATESDVLRAALYPATREGFEAAVLAAQILGQLRDEQAIAQLVELIEQRVPGSAENDDPRLDTFVQPKELRLAAARALARMGHNGGMYVADMYADDPNPLVRSQASFVYGESGLADRLVKLEAMLDDPEQVVRISASAASLALLARLGV